MDTSAFDRDIEKAETELGALKKQAEAAARTIIDAVGQAVGAWSQKCVEDEVTRKPEITKGLGSDSLKKMKEELNALVEAIPSIAETEFMQDPYWPHRREKRAATDSMHSEYQMYSQKLPNRLEKGVDILRYGVGGILMKYGFLSERDHLPSMGLSDSLKTAVNGYANLDNKMIAKESELSELKQKKSEAEARDLWDKA